MIRKDTRCTMRQATSMERRWTSICIRWKRSPFHRMATMVTATMTRIVNIWSCSRTRTSSYDSISIAKFTTNGKRKKKKEKHRLKLKDSMIKLLWYVMLNTRNFFVLVWHATMNSRVVLFCDVSMQWWISIFDVGVGIV